MIHARVTRNPSTSNLDGIHLSITEDSIPVFMQLINRALNCWDWAPKEIKELGDLLTHDRITQDHTFQAMNTREHSRDYYTAAEQEIIGQFIESAGQEAWLEHLRNHTQNKVLKREV